MSFIEDLEIGTSVTLTENGGQAISTTGDDILNLFAVLGALRSRPQDVVEKFNKAYRENADLATKMVFYCRDIRGGLGERTVGRHMLRCLAEVNPEVVIKNFGNIVEFGRWDDLFVLFGTKCEEKMVKFVKNQLMEDMKLCKAGKPISLLAKWMPSVNTASFYTVMLAYNFINAFGCRESTYRKTLSKLRKHIDVVEVKMSDKKWGDINYEGVPSNAMIRYRGAFSRNDYSRFFEYQNDVANGKKKVNTATLYPYDIIEKVRDNWLGKQEIRFLDSMWKNLPNYIDGENNFLVMADVSGSMYGRPMDTSIGLAIYFAERNKGIFSNKFMTFTDTPSIKNVSCGNIKEKYDSVKKHCGYSTNLAKAFNAILATATRTHCPQEELPKALIIISDMEIDSWTGGSLTFTDEIRKRFAVAGYKMPKLVYWNVNSRHDTFHSSKNDNDALLISGQSTTTFKNVIEGIQLTPLEMVVKALSDKRYDSIIVPSQMK